MMKYALMLFAVVFVSVGILRVVEFRAAGINPRQRKFLIPLHILGCLSFGVATVLLALDNEAYKALMSWTFYAGILALFPIHTYVAIKRRLKISQSS